MQGCLVRFCILFFLVLSILLQVLVFEYCKALLILQNHNPCLYFYLTSTAFHRSCQRDLALTSSNLGGEKHVPRCMSFSSAHITCSKRLCFLTSEDSYTLILDYSLRILAEYIPFGFLYSFLIFFFHSSL